MRRGRIFIFLALILILGVVAVFLVVRQSGLMTTTTPEPSAGEEVVLEPTLTPTPVTKGVVALGQPVGLGQTIEDIHLITGTIPIVDLPVGEGAYFTNRKDVIGKRARYDLEQGKVLNVEDLADRQTDISKHASDAAFYIPKGFVAVSIPITRLSSISYAPRRGDHVNVIVTLALVDLDSNYQTKLPNYTAGVLSPGPALLLGLQAGEISTASLAQGEQIRNLTAQVVGGGAASAQGRAENDPLLDQTFYVLASEEQRPRLVSQTLLQNILVLQVGEFPEDDERDRIIKPTPTAAVDAEPTATPAPTATPRPGEAPEDSTVPDVITLVVSPQDAVTLSYLLSIGGNLTLALRSAGDNDIIETEAVTLAFLMEEYDIPVPAKLSFGTEPRVDELWQRYLDYMYP